VSLPLTWLNELPRWEESNGVLNVVTGNKTDFWRETHYGFIHDNGHFAYREVAGDFTATLEFSGVYKEQYDQAGIMLRLDERNWIKAGVEFVGGRQMLSAVVTRDFSDWSTMPMPADFEWVTLRCTRQDAAVRIEWSGDGPEFKLLRLCYLPKGDKALVGPMCCAPTRAGLELKFRGFTIGPATADGLQSAERKRRRNLGLEGQSVVKVFQRQGRANFRKAYHRIEAFVLLNAPPGTSAPPESDLWDAGFGKQYDPYRGVGAILVQLSDPVKVHGGWRQHLQDEPGLLRLH
jgi:regulation of enolase protein 1 (concanavalin A-like superfamily)